MFSTNFNEEIDKELLEIERQPFPKDLLNEKNSTDNKEKSK